MALASLYRVTQDLQGNVVTDVLGTVTLSGTSTLASLFSDAAGTVSLPNPLVNNPTYGSFQIYLGAGSYDMQFVKAGFTFETQRNITLRDPAAGVNQLVGTTNQVIVTPSTGIGTVTLATPQNLDPDASVQFGRLGINTPAATYRLSVNGDAHISADLSVVMAPHGAGYQFTTQNAWVDQNLAVALGVTTPAATLHCGGTLRCEGVALFPGTLRSGTAAPQATFDLLGVNVWAQNNLGVALGATALGANLHCGGTLRADGACTFGAPATCTNTLNVSGLTTLANVNAAAIVGTNIRSGGSAHAGFDSVSVNKWIDQNCGIALGVTALAYNLHCMGTGGIAGGVWQNATSRRDLKRNIRVLTGALATLLRLRERAWEWAEDQPDLEALMPGTQAGFVVDEIAEDKPDWTHTAQDGTPSYSERGSLALVVGAFREVVARLEALEARRPGDAAAS